MAKSGDDLMAQMAASMSLTDEDLGGVTLDSLLCRGCTAFCPNVKSSVMYNGTMYLICPVAKGAKDVLKRRDERMKTMGPVIAPPGTPM